MRGEGLMAGVGTEEMPEGSQVFIVRDTKAPDEVIAFGMFEGNLEAGSR